METIKLHHMEGRSKGGYVTFGVPWKKGEKTSEITYNLYKEGDKSPVSLQEKPIAFYPDGSTKWSAYTARLDKEGSFYLQSGAPAAFDNKNAVAENDAEITVDNGLFTAVFPKSGDVLMKTPYAVSRLKVIKEMRGEYVDCESVKRVPFYGEIEKAEIEESGSLKTVIKISGTHKSLSGDEFLRYVVRFTVFRSEKEIRVMHTFLYDGDESRDFIKGVGIEFTSPISGALYDRHIKITGDFGVMHEAVQLLNLWRPRMFLEAIAQQMADKDVDFSKLVDHRNGNPISSRDMENVTIWDNYRLQQISADSFAVRKRTKGEGCTFIDCNWGKRSKGLMYAGTSKSGIAVCLRDFWQKYPSSVYAEGLSGKEFTMTAWIIPPNAPACDMRHYDTVAHDQTYYEGFPEIGASAYGIANTNELTLFMFDSIPADEALMEYADRVQKPAVVLCDTEYYHEVKALGEWSLIKRDTPLRRWAEDELDKAFDFFKNEIEQRHWYGLWNYGDFMHTYDASRHCWRYDMGGYAWQNTELMPTLWLWYAFIRSQREDIFTVAEAMSRHASDVDIYHFGSLKGLGSRHNVVHWGDSCKEPRIAMAGHHRAMYFLTGGDLRLKDIFDDVKDADFATLDMDPLRYFYRDKESKLPTHARSGPDWSTYCSNWFTQWEINRDEHYKEKIITGINDLKNAPLRLISGSDFEYDPASGHLGYIGENAAGGSHLAVCMGEPQTYFELCELLDDEVFRDMIIQYGEFYFLTPAEKHKKSNGLISGEGFVYPYMAAAMAGYAARAADNKELAYQVWQVLIHSLAGKDKNEGFDTEIVNNYFNTEKLDEMFWISTNFAAQWCLNTIFALELTKDYLPEKIDDVEWAEWTKG